MEGAESVSAGPPAAARAPATARPAAADGVRRAAGSGPRRRRAWLRSIKHRLALMFFAITLLAIAVVYFYVAPSLGTSLRDQKLASLANAAAAYSGPLRRTIGSNVSGVTVQRDVRHAAALANARVTLLGVTTGVANGTTGVDTYYIFDSSSEAPGVPGGSDLQFPVAAEAAREERTLTASETGIGGRVAEAAAPLAYRGRVAEVAVYSAPLNDVQRSVSLIRGKILLAGAIALAIALVGGYMVAQVLSQRVKRLEQAARRVAAGDFSARFAVDSEDELGQLAQALDEMQRQLAELDSARERFIATASHELRTPIFSLGGFLELIQDEDLDEETRKQFVGQVRTQVDRLGKLATGLLDLSRLEAGALELRSEPSDLSLIARTVTSEFIPALTQHSSHLRLRLTQEPLPVTCDPERVAQIMRILIDNAITHTPEGTNLVVTATRVDGVAKVTVRDFGPGVARASMARIFEPFYTSDDVQGSGLGLAIARELAERMSGSLTAESTPGRTVFSFQLPT
jgi:two-component system OmpR family sensor kinase